MRKVYVIFVVYHGIKIMYAKIRRQLDKFRDKWVIMDVAHAVVNVVLMDAKILAQAVEIVIAARVDNAAFKTFAAKYFFIVKVQT